MSSLAAAAEGESLAGAGERIRSAAPIRGDHATDEDCRIRRALIDEELGVRGIHPGAHEWHTAQLVDGHVVGVWANSVEEAELELTAWWGARCHSVTADPQCLLFYEYFPKGKRSATEADRCILLAPPRASRDRFAPADSLLDGIWSPPASAASLAR
ncbi:hypothetical protein [uncultured Microbacterium sp.]|uniref:hypothetical protein n=1 Tax=uncultured Microbacterium sp. TaxID=191216 RepID=UPI0028EA18FD|nr:hypothetical protein [uncultured Microbacterium sp.]